MTETDIDYGHTKTILHARNIKKSCNLVTFLYLNSNNFNDRFSDNFMVEKVKSILVVQWNLYKANTIGSKKCVHFIEIFSKIVWPQSKAIRYSSYCPSYRGFRFIEYLLYRDSTVLTLLRMAFFGAAHGRGRGEGGKKAPLPKICHTYPAVMKLGTVIPYPKKIQKIYESRDTPLEFCGHQHFFIGN